MTPVDTTRGVQVRKVSFLRSNQIVLVGNLFLPAGFDPQKRYPAILSIHPAGSVKEQSAGLYAFRLAENGFVTLAFDAAYTGECGGTPHYSEAPYERVEDIRYAVDYLVTLPFVDEHRIGALGLCAGGGYVIATAPTERRIRAVAGVSAADIGAANREGWLRGRTVEEQIALLEAVSEQRTLEARGAELMKVYMCLSRRQRPPLRSARGMTTTARHVPGIRGPAIAICAAVRRRRWPSRPSKTATC